MANSIPDNNESPGPLKAGHESIANTNGTVPTIQEEEYEQDGEPR